MKNNIPLIILAFVVVIAGALWFSMNPPTEGQKTANVAPLPVIATTSLPSTATPAAPAKGTAPTGAPQVAGQTVWRDITADDWSIVFKVQTSWKVAGVYADETAKDKKLAQVSIGGVAANYFVSKDVQIAEPSKLAYTTTKRTVAGKSVTVHYYKNPSTGYAAYEYFSLARGSDTYYFQIKEMTASPKEVEDFVDFIAFK